MPRLVEFLARPRALGPRYIIDPVAFFVALIGGPLLFTLGTFWIMLIPVAALGFGGDPLSCHRHPGVVVSPQQTSGQTIPTGVAGPAHHVLPVNLPEHWRLHHSEQRRVWSGAFLSLLWGNICPGMGRLFRMAIR